MSNKGSTIISEAYVIEQYIEQYGNISLENLIEQVQDGRINECPACKGVGQTCDNEWNSNYNRSVEWWNDCKVCEGYGYTKKQKVPKMEQVGWN